MFALSVDGKKCSHGSCLLCQCPKKKGRINKERQRVVMSLQGMLGEFGVTKLPKNSTADGLCGFETFIRCFLARRQLDRGI